MTRLSRRAALRLTGQAAATVLAAMAATTRATPTLAAPARQAGKTAVDVLHPWSGDNGGARSMDELARRYREVRPDVEVRYAGAPGGDYERKQAALFAAGRPPDMTLTFAEMLPSYVERGALAPLDDRVTAAGISLADYFDVVVAQSSWGGHLYGMTHHPDLRAIVYRSEPLLRAAGLDPAAEPGTWADLRATGTNATRRDGSQIAVAGWLPIWSEVPWALLFALANGAAPLGSDGRVAFDDPRVVEAIAFAVGALDQAAGGFDPVVDFAARQPGPGQETALAVGSLALAVGASWYLDRLSSNGGDAARRMRLSLMPGGPSSPTTRVSLAGGVVQTIPRGARNPDAAWDYLSWVAGPTGQRAIQSVSYDLAGHRAAARDSAAVSGHLFRAELVDTLEATNAPAHLATPIWPLLRERIEAVQLLALQKQLTPAQAAAELQSSAQALLDANRATGRPVRSSTQAAQANRPPTPAAASGTNLLRNPGFEGGTYRDGISSSVASDWSRWFQHRGTEDPGFWLPEPEYGVLVGRAGQSHSGSKAHRWFNSWSIHNGGVYQTAAVPPGAWLRFSAWLFSWSSQADEFAHSDPDGFHRRWVGIDPDGGVDPYDPRIVWSSADVTMDRWGQVAITAQARADRVTVFVRTQPEFATKHNDVLLDDAELVVVGAPGAAALLAADPVAPMLPDPATAVDVTTGSPSGSLGPGAHALFAFDYPGGEVLRRISVQASPDDGAALARFGFRVYGPRWGDVYAMSGVQVGQRPNVMAVLPAGEAGRYLIDVYNLNPSGQVDFQIALATK